MRRRMVSIHHHPGGGANCADHLDRWVGCQHHDLLGWVGNADGPGLFAYQLCNMVQQSGGNVHHGLANQLDDLHGAVW